LFSGVFSDSDNAFGPDLFRTTVTTMTTTTRFAEPSAQALAAAATADDSTMPFESTLRHQSQPELADYDSARTANTYDTASG